VDEFLAQVISAPTVGSYLEKMFPGLPHADKEREVEFICSRLGRTRFRTLADIDGAVQRTKKAVAALAKHTSVYSGQELQYALAFADTSMRGSYTDWFDALFTKHRHLVDNPDQ